MGQDDGLERSARSCTSGPFPIELQASDPAMSLYGLLRTQLTSVPFVSSYRDCRSFPRDPRFLLLLLYLSLTRLFRIIVQFLVHHSLYQLNNIQSFLSKPVPTLYHTIILNYPHTSTRSLSSVGCQHICIVYAQPASYRNKKGSLGRPHRHSLDNFFFVPACTTTSKAITSDLLIPLRRFCQ